MDEIDIPLIDNDNVNNVIDGLSAQPCLLAIVVIAVVFAYIVRSNYKHVEKMEGERARQMLALFNKKSESE